MTFDELLTQVEEIVRALQEGSVPLEKALDLYEEGFRRIGEAQGKLGRARQKLEVLRKQAGDDGQAES